MIYMSSDLHIGHARILDIIPQRPWETVEEMNEGLIHNFNNLVKANDLLILLGDVCMGKKFETVPEWLPKLQCLRICLVRGNHDAGFDDARPGKKELADKLYLDNGITKLYDGQVMLEQVLLDMSEPIPYDLSYVNLSHFPFVGASDHADMYEARYKNLLVKDTGSWLIHGHQHNTTPMSRKRMYDVGVDANEYSPVNLDNIVSRVALYKE